MKRSSLLAAQKEQAKIGLKQMYDFTVDESQYTKANVKLPLTCNKCKTVIQKSWVDLQNAKWYNRPLICYTCNPKIIKNKADRCRSWAKSIKRKYNHECVACGKSHNTLYNENKTLDAHHIVPYSFNEELRTDLNNGAPLCYNCHKYYHDVWAKNTAPKTTSEYIEDFNNFLHHLTNKNLNEIKDIIKQRTLSHITTKIQEYIAREKPIAKHIKEKYNNMEYEKSWESFLYHKFKLEHYLKNDTDIYKPKQHIIKKYTWEEHKDAVATFKCNSIFDYWELCKFHPELYKAPERNFEEHWISWPDFLNKKKHNKEEYLSYDEASIYCQKLNIYTSRDYWELAANTAFLPHMPSHQYKSSWISWPHFLNWDSRKKSRIY